MQTNNFSFDFIFIPTLCLFLFLGDKPFVTTSCLTRKMILFQLSSISDDTLKRHCLVFFNISHVPSGAVSFLCSFFAEMHHWFLCVLLQLKQVLISLCFSSAESIVLALPKIKNGRNHCHSFEQQMWKSQEHIASPFVRHKKTVIVEHEKKTSRPQLNFELHRSSRTVSDSINSRVREEELLLLLILYFVPSQTFNESSPLVQLLLSSAKKKKLKQIFSSIFNFPKKEKRKSILYLILKKLWG